MRHDELASALRALERELTALDDDACAAYLPRFEAEIERLAAHAEDPDDAVYVIDRADALLGDLGIG